MSLADYQPERVSIEYKGKPLVSVRGLNFEDVTVLVHRHLPDLKALYEMYQNQQLTNGDDLEKLLFEVLASSPNTVALLIAMASDEPESMAKAKLLPLPLQLNILIEVVRLTFEDVGGPLAFAAMLNQVMTKAAAAIPANPTIQ